MSNFRKSMLSALAISFIISILLATASITYAESEILPPLPANISQLESSQSTGEVTTLDLPTYQRETFEWESSPCEGGGTAAYVDGDSFECGWTYGEDPDSTYIEIIRTTETNWGSYAAFWDGPDVGIGNSSWNWIIRRYSMNIPSPSGKYVSWKHKQKGGASADQCYYIILYDSEGDYAYSDCVRVTDTRWNYKALGDDSPNGWEYMRSNNLDMWATVTVADGFEWNDIKYIQIERVGNNAPTDNAEDIMDDVFLVEDYPPDPITGLTIESKGADWIKINWNTWDADGDFKRYEIQYRVSGEGWRAPTYENYEYNSNFLKTGLSPGTTYEFRVRVEADNGDVSTWSSITGTTTDTTPPSISTPSESSDPICKSGTGSPTQTTITATVNDTGRGNSNIASAKLYYQPPGGSWTFISMSAQDGAFDEVIEVVTGTIGPFSSTGTANYYLEAKDAAGNTAYKGSQTSPYTVAVNDCTLPPPPNPDGDDLTTDEENAIYNGGPVEDALGRRFPDPTKTDAFKPVHAAELYYQNNYYGKTLGQTFSGSVENKDTDFLAERALYLSFVYKTTSNQTLKNDIQPKLEAILNEIIYRQRKDDYYWNTTVPKPQPEVGESLNIKGYIKRNRIEGNFDADKYSRVPLYVGPASMALLEGYDTLNGILPYASEYLSAGLSSAEMTIRWLESRGFDSNGSDPWPYYSLLQKYIQEHTGSWVEPPEKLHNGGDEAMSTANHYGSTLLAVATAERISPGNTYFKQVAGSHFPDDRAYSYNEISDWIVDEMRRLQRARNEAYEGGIRDGPLGSYNSSDICNSVSNRNIEHLSYAAMTAHGMRQAYDLTTNSQAWDFLRDLAQHYWEMRNGFNNKPKKWFDVYDLDKYEPLCGIQTQNDIYWAALLQLVGNYTRGFRQAMVDRGNFLSSRDSMLNYVIVQAIKMRDNKYVIIPINETQILAGLGIPVKIVAAYSNPIIYPSEVKTVQVAVDPTVRRLIAEVDHANNSNLLEFSIYMPNGTKITQSNYNSFAGVNYSVNGTYMLYTVDNPAAGNWTLELKAVSVPSSGEWYYMQGAIGTWLSADVERDVDWYFKGENVMLTVRVINDTQIIANVSLSSKLTMPDGRKVTLDFRDDGTSGDYEAGDGIYTTVFTDTKKSGGYNVEITAAGQLAGAAFTRKAEASFEVVGVEEEIKEAFFTGLIHNRDYYPGDTVTGFIYVGNEGNIAIDDELQYTIKGPTGQWMYRKWEPIYLVPDEVQYLKFSWFIQTDAPSGLYHLTVEFDDLDIEGFQLSKWFWISGFTVVGIPERRRRRKSKALILLMLIGIGISGCLQQPMSLNTNISETNVTAITPKENNITFAENASLPKKNLTEVNFSYIIPINRTIIEYIVYDDVKATRAYQYEHIDKIGDTNLSFHLGYDSDAPQESFSILQEFTPSGEHYFLGYIRYQVIETHYFKIAYNKLGVPVELNYSRGDGIQLKNNSPEKFYSGEELPDWNMRVRILSSREEYYINFTILEPIPVIDN